MKGIAPIAPVDPVPPLSKDARRAAFNEANGIAPTATPQQQIQQQIAAKSAQRTAAMNAPPAPTLVGSAPPWLQSQGVEAWRGGPQVSLTNPNWEGLPEVPSNFADQEKAAADAAYKGATQYFDQDFGRDRAGLESQLENQGFMRGTEGFDTAMSQQQRGQDAARENAAYMAQGVGHQQAGDLLMRALQTRAAALGERNDMSDRLFGQSMGVAQLGLGARGQDQSLSGTRIASSASAGSSHYATDAARDNHALDAELALRNLGPGAGRAGLQPIGDARATRPRRREHAQLRPGHSARRRQRLRHRFGECEQRGEPLGE
jgi:hypothetical protein